MTTITKERLLTIKQWRETYGPGSNVVLPAEEAEELARIALASLEAEPVAYTQNERIRLYGISEREKQSDALRAVWGFEIQIQKQGVLVPRVLCRYGG